MQLPITRTFATLCALLAMAAMGQGCDKKRTLNQFFAESRGTDARDAVDTDDEIPARLVDPSNRRKLGGRGPAMPVDGGGNLLAHVAKAYYEDALPFNSSHRQVGTYLFSHVIGDAIGGAGELGNHADPAYQGDHFGRAQSPDQRFTVLLQSPDGPIVRPSVNAVAPAASIFAQQLAVTVFDAQRGTYAAPLTAFDVDQVSDADIFDTIATVDNTGLVTLLIPARPLDNGAFSGTTPSTLFAVQLDGTTGRITRPLTDILKPFADASASGNSRSLQDGAVATNGDIALVYLQTEAGQVTRTSLEAVTYDRSSDTFRASARVDLGLTHTTDPLFTNIVVETDGKSFQLAYAQAVSASATVPGLFTSRFVAGTGTGFGTPTRIDSADGVNSAFSGTVGIHFGRDGTSIVSYVQQDAGQGRFYASWSREGVAPTAANTVRLTDELNASFEDGNPQFAFQDDGSALIVRRTFNAGNPQIQVNTLDLSAASPRITTVSAAFDLATESTDGNLTGPLVSGYAAGTNATCVIAWQSNSSAGTLLNAILVSDLATGARTELQATTTQAIFDLHMVSLNNVKTLLSYEQQWDEDLDPQTLPAAGGGQVWLGWTQRRVHPQGFTAADRAYAWVFDPAANATQLGGAATVAQFGGDGVGPADGVGLNVESFEGIHPASDGSAMAFFRHENLVHKVDLRGGGSLTSRVSVGTPTVVVPEDMVEENAFVEPIVGLHVDGHGWSYATGDDGASVSASFHGGRLWTFFQGRDILTNRVFAIRSR